MAKNKKGQKKHTRRDEKQGRKVLIGITIGAIVIIVLMVLVLAQFVD